MKLFDELRVEEKDIIINNVKRKAGLLGKEIEEKELLKKNLPITMKELIK